jgi:transketolase
MVRRACEVAENLSRTGIGVSVLDMYRIKPFPADMLGSILRGFRSVVTLEEHCLSGGLGSACADYCAEEGMHVPFKKLGVPDVFCHAYGSRQDIHEVMKLSTSDVVHAIKKFLS